MSRGKTIGVVLCLMAMASFASFPLWRYLYARNVSETLQARTKALVDKNPQLQLGWTIALQDDVLTYPEAKTLIEAGGEKVGPDE